MNKTELESKHLAELHALAADAGVPRYRMLPRAELIEKLADGKPAKQGERPRGERRDRPERPPRRRRERPARKESAPAERRSERASREPAPEPKAAAPAPSAPEPAGEQETASAASESGRPKRRRRRRRFGRKSKGLRVQELLSPPPGRQALVYGESRAACTSLLREIAAEVGGASEGPDPIALLIDPSPEELADWKREAPDAELVVAAQARHASDALAQASRRAESGEDVILLVDSLTRLEDADTAKEIFDGGLSLKANGSLTVVAALERQQ
ncbi:MAG TPA: Rho termination factor N-terminal domain-containing protein [Solirubrobacterales bacterium]|nr:Rho termination factor N-terminal domain-containing protein [Solirubrobacterales bacterium]